MSTDFKSRLLVDLYIACIYVYRYLTLKEERKGQFNWFRARAKFKSRYFILTNYDLTYGKKKSEFIPVVSV